MRFRIGINVGDVMVKDGDIFGDGVNIAARLEGLAEPGGICVTRAVRDQLRDRVEAKFEDLGEHSVKNIARPVRVFRVDLRPQRRAGAAGVSRGTTENASQREVPNRTPAPHIAIRWRSPSGNPSRRATTTRSIGSIWSAIPNGAFADLARARLRRRPAVDDPGVELAFWETVRESGNAAMLRAYLEKYPDGEFRSLAEIMLDEAHGAMAQLRRARDQQSVLRTVLNT